MRTIFKPTKPKILLSIFLFLLCGYVLTTSIVGSDMVSRPNDYNFITKLNDVINFIPMLIIKLADTLSIQFLGSESILFIVSFVLILFTLWIYFLSCFLIIICNLVNERFFKKYKNT